MSRRTDGRHLLARLAYPLPITVGPEILAAVGRAAEQAGYTDVSLDPSDPGAIVGTPPAVVADAEIALPGGAL